MQTDRTSGDGFEAGICEECARLGFDPGQGMITVYDMFNLILTKSDQIELATYLLKFSLLPLH